MNEIFMLENDWWTLVLRAMLVYAGMLVAMRFAGKRELGQFTPFDFVVLLIVSEAVSESLKGGEKSVPGGMLVVVTLIVANAIVGRLTRSSPRLERLIEGEPEFLVRNGKVDYHRLRALGVSHNDLLAAIRKAECLEPSEVAWAVLETSGEISVKKTQK